MACILRRVSHARASLKNTLSPKKPFSFFLVLIVNSLKAMWSQVRCAFGAP
jgi:hypothetical protein